MSQSKHSPAYAAGLVLDEFGKDNIKAGAYIPPEIISSALGMFRGSSAYGLALLGLRQALESLVEKVTARPCWIRQSASGLRVLTLEEASKYYPEALRSGRRRMEYAHAKAEVVINPYLEELSESAREHYVAERRFNSRLLLAMKEIELDRIPDLDSQPNGSK